MARQFDGNNDWLSVADHANLDITGNLTMAAWIYNPVAGTTIFGKPWTTTHSSPYFAYSLFVSYVGGGNNGELEVRISQNASTTTTLVGTTDLRTAAWQHVAMTWDGTTLRAFHNGSQENSSTPGISSIGATAQDLRVGVNRALGEDFSGRQAELCLWNAALSANEIAALSRGALPIDIRYSNLQLYLPLYGIASPEPDYSQNRFTATVQAGTTKADHAPVVGFNQRRLAKTSVPLIETAAGFAHSQTLIIA